MKKDIKSQLNNFPIVPEKLRELSTVDKAKESFDVDLSRLYHHYYFDCYGCAPPSPDYTNFEYLRFLANCDDFRFIKNAGASTGEHKRTISNKLGQAYCRYFLNEFLEMDYFVHISKVLNKKDHPAMNGMDVKRIQKGDSPDYFCTNNSNVPYLAEAKGRFSEVSFIDGNFDLWREQFSRVQVFNKSGYTLKVKGFITATQFATESAPNTFSTLFAEDPETIGEFTFDNQIDIGLGRLIKSLHYSRVLSKLGLNLYSSSLAEGFVVPQDLLFNMGVWRCIIPDLSNERFVGGFFSNVPLQFDELPDGTHRHRTDLLILNNPNAVFVGLEIGVMKTLRHIILGNWEQLNQIPTIEDRELRPSNLAWLRDGTIAGSLDFFVLEGIVPI